MNSNNNFLKSLNMCKKKLQRCGIFDKKESECGSSNGKTRELILDSELGVFAVKGTFCSHSSIKGPFCA